MKAMHQHGSFLLCYNLFMKKIKDNGKFKVDKQIEEYFDRAWKCLEKDEDTEEITDQIFSHFAKKDFVFYITAMPEIYAIDYSSPKIRDIEALDSLSTNDFDDCLPLFSNVFHLKKDKPKLEKDEFIYAISSKELLTLLSDGGFSCAQVNPDSIGMMIYLPRLQKYIEEEQ